MIEISQKNNTPIILKIVGVLIAVLNFTSFGNLEKNLIGAPSWFLQFAYVIAILYVIIGIQIYKGRKIGFNGYFAAKSVEIIASFTLLGEKAIWILIPQLLGSTIAIGILLFYRKSFK